MLGAFFLFLSVSSSQSFKIMVLCLYCNLLNFQQIQSNKYDLAVLELSHLNCPFKEDQHHHAMAVPFFFKLSGQFKIICMHTVNVYMP